MPMRSASLVRELVERNRSPDGELVRVAVRPPRGPATLNRVLRQGNRVDQDMRMQVFAGILLYTSATAWREQGSIREAQERG